MWTSADRIVRLLLDAGADVHARDFSGSTVLHVFMKEGTCGFVDVSEAVKMILQAGADVNVIDNDGYTPLSFACSYSYEEASCFPERIVPLLIEAGGKIGRSLEIEDGPVPEYRPRFAMPGEKPRVR